MITIKINPIIHNHSFIIVLSNARTYGQYTGNNRRCWHVCLYPISHIPYPIFHIPYSISHIPYPKGCHIPSNDNYIARPIRFYGPEKWTTVTQLRARHAFMDRRNGQRQRNCAPDTLLWTVEMDNGNAIARPMRFYGPEKWTTATHL